MSSREQILKAMDVIVNSMNELDSRTMWEMAKGGMSVRQISESHTAFDICCCRFLEIIYRFGGSGIVSGYEAFGGNDGGNWYPPDMFA